jgi:superoxide dismutase, Cu-Zn family
VPLARLEFAVAVCLSAPVAHGFLLHTLPKLHRLAAAAILLSVSALPAEAQAPPSVGATAELRDATGRVVATADFREGRGEVLVTLNFPSPPVLSGTHGLHINDTGRCDPPDFSTSGKIFNPLGKHHGRQNPEGSEVGDLPNVNFSTGLTAYNTTAIGATLGGGSTSLLSPNRSIVIYSGEDDQKTDPDGNPGTAVACGVIAAGSAAAQPAAKPAVGVSSPGPGAAPAVVASPVPPQPVVAQPQPPAAQVQPPAAQPVAQQQPGQPAAKPASSPIVVGKPVVVVSNNTPSATATPANAAALPTPIGGPVAAQTSAQSSGGLSPLNALLIAVLGGALVVVGLLLRQRRQAH